MSLPSDVDTAATVTDFLTSMLGSPVALVRTGLPKVVGSLAHIIAPASGDEADTVLVVEVTRPGRSNTRWRVPVGEIDRVKFHFNTWDRDLKRATL